jgi:hypothetical protein
MARSKRNKIGTWCSLLKGFLQIFIIPCNVSFAFSILNQDGREGKGFEEEIGGGP